MALNNHELAATSLVRRFGLRGALAISVLIGVGMLCTCDASAQSLTTDQRKQLADLKKEFAKSKVLFRKKEFEQLDALCDNVETQVVQLMQSANLSKEDRRVVPLLKKIASARQIVDRNLPVSAPPNNLGLDPFYKKHVAVRGFPIVSSEKVPDEALLKARIIIRHMTSKRPEILDELKKRKVRVAIMAESELTTDIPEHANLMPKDHWDERARGVGATVYQPAVSCAEENLLEYPNDSYKGENNLVNLFANTVHSMAMNHIEDDFDERLQKLFESAITKGLWANTAAAKSHIDYFCEGVQSWFNVNLEVKRPDGVHNHVNTRRELQVYDPEFAKFISNVFP